MNPEIQHIETYYDTVPRTTALVEQIGPFTLFAGSNGQEFYARPVRESSGPVTARAVELVRRRQRELGQPEAFEWIDELHQGLYETVKTAGLLVQHVPLMVQRDVPLMALPPGYHARLLTAEDDSLPAVLAAIGVGFHSPGTDVGPAGTKERDAVLAKHEVRDPPAHRGIRDAIRNGWTTIATVEDQSGPVAGGSHSPRGSVTEITGVATLPMHRQRGIGAAVTGLLCADADSRGIGIRFLSAASEDVARIYARCGFVRIGTGCIASAAAERPDRPS